MPQADLPLTESDIPVFTVKSTADGAGQTVRFWAPESAAPGVGPAVSLLVCLHTWGGNAMQDMKAQLRECKTRGWAFIEPDFRGPNKRPEACASGLAVQDVLDAVAFARDHARIDERRIYLLGGSGGGHMSLVMAARAPHFWAGVSAWVPIADLAVWHTESLARNNGYADDIVAVCGGAPGASAEVDKQYRHRSPIHFLAAAKGLPIEISAGIEDGHKGSVPISHTLHAFNLLAEVNGHPQKRVSQAQIDQMTGEMTIPPELAAECAEEPALKALFRRQAGPVRVTIFQGGHSMAVANAACWLSAAAKPTPGKQTSHTA